MIQVDAATIDALKAPVTEAVMRASFRSFDQTGYGGSPPVLGEDFDVSDALLGFPNTDVRMAPYLGGVSERRISVGFDNSDNFWTPGNANGPFGNRDYLDRFAAHIHFYISVVRADGTTEDIPIYTGWIRRILVEGVTANVDLESRSELLKRSVLEEGVGIDRWNDSPSSLAQSLIETVLTLGDGTFADASWDYHTQLYKDIDWSISGKVPASGSVYDAATLLAKCGMAAIVPMEDGRFRWVSMFPEQDSWVHDHYPDLIDKTNAGGWGYGEAVETTATRVSVLYQGVSVAIAAPLTLDDRPKTFTRTVGLPYIALGRCARTAAFMLHERYQKSPPIIRWTMGPMGTLLQVGDRAKVQDPFSETTRTVVVVSKGWTQNSVSFEGVAFNDEATIVQGSFAKWDTTTWGDSTDLML